MQAAVRGLTKHKALHSRRGVFRVHRRGRARRRGAETQLVLRSGSERAQSSVRVAPAPQKDATTSCASGRPTAVCPKTAPRCAARTRMSAVQIGDAVVGGNVVRATKGSDGTGSDRPTTFADAFSLLDTITDASLLAVPGEGSPAMVDLGMAYCANRPLRDMFYIGEMADHDVTAQDAAAFRAKLTALNSYGAVYFPWVKALDPSGRSDEPMLLPPSGYIAGLYARIDAARGVWKAPAGAEASLNGVVGLAAELTDVEHGNLNPLGVNVLRRLPAGVVSFGARTLSSDPEWRYIPVRRTAIMLRVSIYYGIQWAVFEPNDESLWSQLRLNIGALMTTLFRQGAFQGSTTAEAFFVKCDGETTTQADIDRGVVNVQVGFAAAETGRVRRRHYQPESRPGIDVIVWQSTDISGVHHGAIHRQQHPVRSVPRIPVQDHHRRPNGRRGQQVQSHSNAPPRSPPGMRAETPADRTRFRADQVRTDHAWRLGSPTTPRSRNGPTRSTTSRATPRCRWPTSGRKSAFRSAITKAYRCWATTSFDAGCRNTRHCLNWMPAPMR